MLVKIVSFKHTSKNRARFQLTLLTWQELIDSGTYSNAIELARAVGKDTAYVARTIRLTLLAPEIVHAILHGTLKKSISMETLRKSWPENWEEQKAYFGLI